MQVRHGCKSHQPCIMKSTFFNRKSGFLNRRSGFFNRKSTFFNMKSGFFHCKLTLRVPVTAAVDRSQPRTLEKRSKKRSKNARKTLEKTLEERSKYTRKKRSKNARKNARKVDGKVHGESHRSGSTHVTQTYKRRSNFRPVGPAGTRYLGLQINRPFFNRTASFFQGQFSTISAFSIESPKRSRHLYRYGDVT